MTTASTNPNEVLKMIALQAIDQREAARKKGEAITLERDGFSCAVWWEGKQLCLGIVKVAT